MASGLVVLRINVSIQSDTDISITQNSLSSLSKCPKPMEGEASSVSTWERATPASQESYFYNSVTIAKPNLQNLEQRTMLHVDEMLEEPTTPGLCRSI